MHDLIPYAAHQLRAHGYVPVPLIGKRPVLKEWWVPLPWDRLRFELTRERRNIGILLSGQKLAVVDVDDPTSQWVIERQTLIDSSPQICRSSRGTHSYLRIEEDRPGWKFPGGEVKTKGVVCCPPSEHPTTGKVYEWVSGIVRKEFLP